MFGYFVTFTMEIAMRLPVMSRLYQILMIIE